MVDLLHTAPEVPFHGFRFPPDNLFNCHVPAVKFSFYTESLYLQLQSFRYQVADEIKDLYLKLWKSAATEVIHCFRWVSNLT